MLRLTPLLLTLAPAAGADVYVLLADLDGSLVGSPGTGAAVVTLDDVTGQAHVVGTYDQLVGTVTAVHLHGPGDGTPNGGLLLHLDHTGGTSGTFEGAGVLDLEDMADLLLLDGYVNVHSTFAPGGEVRGFLTWRPVLRPVRLAPDAVVPPVTSPGAGAAELRLDPTTREVILAGTYQGLGGAVTGAFLRGGTEGSEGKTWLAFDHTGGSTGVLSGGGVLGQNKFAAALAGEAYVEVETSAEPRGELRGQARTGEVGVPFCTPAPSSTGAAGRLRALGSAVLAANDLTLAAAGLPPHGLATFLIGPASGQVLLPGSDARLCLAGGALGRYAPFDTGSAGAGERKVNLGQLPLDPPAAAQPGETWNFQCWFEDPADPAAPSNFTNAVSITLK